MNYPCVKLFSEESISFPWNSSFKEVRDADLKAFLHQCGTAVSLIETELKQRQQQGQRKRPTGLEGYRERLRKCAARIKISQTLDKKQATDNAKIAATVMASNQTNRFDKIYQDILFDIARLCGPELVLLCAAALGKHRISHLNKDDQLHLLKFLQEKKRELNVNGLAALADLYEIPRSSPGSFPNLARRRTWDQGPGADSSDSPHAPATPCQNAVNAHTEPSETCPATASVAPKA